MSFLFQMLFHESQDILRQIVNPTLNRKQTCLLQHLNDNKYVQVWFLEFGIKFFFFFKQKVSIKFGCVINSLSLISV